MNHKKQIFVPPRLRGKKLKSNVVAASPDTSVKPLNANGAGGVAGKATKGSPFEPQPTSSLRKSLQR